MNFAKTIRAHKGLLGLTLAVGLLFGIAVGNSAGVVNAGGAAATPLAIPSPVQLPNTFTELAKKLEPSVVQVTSTAEQKVSQRGRAMPFDGGNGSGLDPFERFFGNPFGDLPQRPFRRQATGSGFVVDSKGYILTNNHVVEDATRIQVKLHSDRTEYAAKLVGADPESDLAVLKIDAGRPLPAAKIGNSDAVQVGDWAVAIGSPFGLEETVTAGIISAKGRDLGGPEHQLQRFLQTDAAINPGNSGGPLTNINGEVIGINTAIATESGGYQGIGFALPINLAVNVYNQLITAGKVSRGAIGISFAKDEKPELLKAYGASQGVFVRNVAPGGPADKAGIKVADVIVALNGKPVKDGEDLVSRVSEAPVGSQATLTVLRDGRNIDLKLDIADRAQVIAGNTRPGGARPGGPGRKGTVNAKFGISVQDLGARERESLGLTEKSGVLITDVQSGSFAEDIGLSEGDVLTAINRQPISSVADLERIQNTLKPGDAVAFRVLRNAAQLGLQGRAEWQPFFTAGTLPANS
jgi:serine protease Do